MGIIDKTVGAAIIWRWFRNAWRALFDGSEPPFKRALRIALALLALGAIGAFIANSVFGGTPAGIAAPGGAPARAPAR